MEKILDILLIIISSLVVINIIISLMLVALGGKIKVLQIIGVNILGILLTALCFYQQDLLQKSFLEPVSTPISMPYLDKIIELKGIRELPGKDFNHPFIIQALANIGVSKEKQIDTTSWCSAGLNLIMKQSGMIGTGSGFAESWLKWGKHTDTAVVGAVCVFFNGDSYHVTVLKELTIYHYRMGDVYLCIGCNQSDAIRVSPFDINNLVDMRLPDGDSYVY